MPLVLTQSEATASGHAYADVFGESYEYPVTYRRTIRSGERFVYYRGRRKAGGGTHVQAYLGAGVVGDIRDSAIPGRLVCRIEDFIPFGDPVPFRDEEGAYLEPGASRHRGGPSLYFRRGVRRIDESTFARILGRAEDAPGAGATAPHAAIGPYASPETARAVDSVAMELAAAVLRDRFPGLSVLRMPQNNPGYDLEIRDGDGVVRRYVEVKGTTRPRPEFLITEGERLFSLANPDLYTLLVIHSIDLDARTGVSLDPDGPIEDPPVSLRARVWTGVLRSDGERSTPAGRSMSSGRIG